MLLTSNILFQTGVIEFWITGVLNLLAPTEISIKNNYNN